MNLVILFTLAAYLLGSIPTSVWIGQYFYGIDVRKYGSGNAGATNTFRVLGVRAGIPVMLFDVLKGFLAVKLVRFIPFLLEGSNPYISVQIALGMAAVLGHVFPIYVGFKGGKGVATLLGVVLSVHPSGALIAACIFVAVLLVTRYVSLSSMIAGISFPVVIVTYYKVTSIPLIIFSMSIAVLLLFTHQQNIERLIRHEESKANLFRKKKAKKSGL